MSLPLPLVLEDGRACGLDVMRIIDSGYAPETDRRQRVRVALAIPVYVFHESEPHAYKGRTKNISADGFYCLVEESFAAGEQIRVVLLFPAFNPRRGDQTMTIECRARVLRSEPVESGYGIGCRIESYHVLIASAEEMARPAAGD